MEFKDSPDASMPLWIEHPVKNVITGKNGDSNQIQKIG